MFVPRFGHHCGWEPSLDRPSTRSRHGSVRDSRVRFRGNRASWLARRTKLTDGGWHGSGSGFQAWASIWY